MISEKHSLLQCTDVAAAQHCYVTYLLDLLYLLYLLHSKRIQFSVRCVAIATRGGAF